MADLRKLCRIQRQCDVCQRRDGMLVIVLQHEPVAGLSTRIVAPLIPKGRNGRGLRGSNPTAFVGARTCAVAFESPAAATDVELGTHVANLAHRRDEITGGLARLFTGL